MPVSAAVALTAHLNACRHSSISAEVAARGVVGDHAAHHVIDDEGILGLDPLAASELDTAIRAALLLVDSDWVLTLPRPGRLAPLTGPPALTSVALESGAAVVPVAGGPAWVPLPVGPAIQWQLTRANPPRAIVSLADADRRLRETVLHAANGLAEAVPGHSSQPESHRLTLPQRHDARAQQLAARAWQLLAPVEAALADDTGALHVHALESRRRTLTEVRDAAEEALCAAVSWTGRAQR